MSKFQFYQPVIGGGVEVRPLDEQANALMARVASCAVGVKGEPTLPAIVERGTRRGMLSAQDVAELAMIHWQKTIFGKQGQEHAAFVAIVTEIVAAVRRGMVGAMTSTPSPNEEPTQ